ncbi:8659_t:CDS:2 [Acaulospora morrowiae]|uniref:8659_t:CDS:1 n=1 Tax=Acaulospora morrowiae TaxID=94023 RepID=A0A9N9G7F9_9GLOM|nr:8659_t:CDS:2 [Acaulospora morrowiae]
MIPTLEEEIKPQSMPSGPRNVLRSNDSASLWNCTLSPGWSREESDILRKALMKFGIGNWAKIIDSQCLPGKTNAQMNLQLQRMLGQQSTAEFAGLHIDPLVIGEKNSKIQGPDIKRKNNCIVNTGGKLSKEEIKRRLLQNKQLYEITEEEWNKIELPRPEDVFEVWIMKQELENVQAQIANIRRIQRGENLETVEPSSFKEILKMENGKQRSTRNSKRTKRK